MLTSYTVLSNKIYSIEFILLKVKTIVYCSSKRVSITHTILYFNFIYPDKNHDSSGTGPHFAELRQPSSF